MSHDSPSELSESEAIGEVGYSALNNFLRSLGMISVIERTENNNLMTWQSEIEFFRARNQSWNKGSHTLDDQANGIIPFRFAS